MCACCIRRTIRRRRRAVRRSVDTRMHPVVSCKSILSLHYWSLHENVDGIASLVFFTSVAIELQRKKKTDDVDCTLDIAAATGWCLQWINNRSVYTNEISYKNYSAISALMLVYLSPLSTKQTTRWRWGMARLVANKLFQVFLRADRLIGWSWRAVEIENDDGKIRCEWVCLFWAYFSVIDTQLVFTAECRASTSNTPASTFCTEPASRSYNTPSVEVA